MTLDDATHYDIGDPFLSVRFPNGTIAHTPNGLVISVDSGTRYTCSYNRLLSILKISSKSQQELIEQTNIMDIVDKFNNHLKKLEANAKATELFINNQLKKQNNG